jgi:hypothetical protein
VVVEVEVVTVLVSMVSGGRVVSVEMVTTSVLATVVVTVAVNSIVDVEVMSVEMVANIVVVEQAGAV